MHGKFLLYHEICDGTWASRHGEALVEVAMLFSGAVSRTGFPEYVSKGKIGEFMFPRNHIRPFWIFRLRWCLLRV
jgi:hypothetical protein